MIHGFDDTNKEKVEVPSKSEAVLKTQLLNLVYPVGAIYMSVNTTSPATLFGGTWEQITGRFLLASGSGYTNGATGGEATHKLTVEEMPYHNHSYNYGVTIDNTHKPTYTDGLQTTAPMFITGVTSTDPTQGVGGDGAHNNMPPYLVVNVWKRTA